MKFKILIPIYNDWQSISELLDNIEFVIGNEWSAGNLSYHLKSRPTWEGFINDEIFSIANEYLCIDDVCVGTYK